MIHEARVKLIFERLRAMLGDGSPEPLPLGDDRNLYTRETEIAFGLGSAAYRLAVPDVVFEAEGTNLLDCYIGEALARIGKLPR